MLSRYQSTLKPMHMEFIEPTKEFADIIIPTNRYNTVAVKLIQTSYTNACHNKNHEDFRIEKKNGSAF